MRHDPQPLSKMALEIVRSGQLPDECQANDSTSEPDLLSQLHNDQGNACRLIAAHGGELRYCHAFKKWLTWDDRRWVVDATGRACWLAKQTMLLFLAQAVEQRNGACEKFAKESLDSRSIGRMLWMAECEIFIQPEDLDKDPYLLNFENGTVDLRTGELRPHRREDFITKLVHYAYNPLAVCPRWQAFLDQAMGGGPDANEGALICADRLVSYIQRALGYSLTGCTIEKAVFVLFGVGDNGKSTMLSTFRQVIEEYSVLLQVDTLMVRQESSNSQADLADLRGARFVQTSETEEGQRLAQGKLKRITQGMGRIKAVRKYENPIEFYETHKLWMDTNRKPIIRDTDDKATFNRLHPIEFGVTIPPGSIDKDLPAKLAAEADGILAWAVRGALTWYKNGLNKPYEIDAAKDEWRSDMDQVGRFRDECCVIGDAFQVLNSKLYAEYRHWAETGGEHAVTGKAFGVKLSDLFEKKHTNRGDVYRGIGLRDGER